MRPSGQSLLSPPPRAEGDGARAGNGNATAADANPWGPFGNASTYGADMALAIGILLSGFVLGVLLMFGVRFYLRRCRRNRNPGVPSPAAGGAGAGRQKPGLGRDGSGRAGGPSEPPTLYSAGRTELAGAGAECAICLTEFEEGDALRVLPACKHGFHLECSERWLASSSGSSRRPSFGRTTAPCCPVCRTVCLPPRSSPSPQPENPDRAGDG